MISTVILDVDDTLFLTEAVCFELENDTLRAIGRPPMSREIHLKTWGQMLFDAIAERSPGVDLDAFKAAYPAVIDHYIRDGKLDALTDENSATLDKLVADGYKLMIVTSRTHGEVKHLLEQDHLLAKTVEAFYYKDTTAYYKPDPRVFDELLKEHNLRPEECVYVGDSLGDAAAAKGAGLHFIASLESGLRTQDAFSDYAVDAFIMTFPELRDVVKALDA